MNTDRKSQIRFARPGLLALAIALFPGCNCQHDPLTPQQAEQVFIDNLKASGQVPPDLAQVLEPKVTALWKASSEIGLASLKSNHRPPSDLQSVGAISCFKGGCMQQLRFKDRGAATFYEEDVLEGPRSPLRHWPGRIYRGPLIQDGEGQVRATWGLLLETKHHRELKALAAPHAETKNTSNGKTEISDLQRGDQ